MKRAILAIFLIFMTLLVYSVGALRTPAQDRRAPGQRIIEDESFFDGQTASNLTLDSPTMNWSKLRYSLPERKQPRIKDIMEKYGEPDRVLTEKAPKLKPGVDVESYDYKSQQSPVIWVSAAVYYYGRIGFGVEENDPDGSVRFVINQTDAPSAEPSMSNPTVDSASEAITVSGRKAAVAGSFDGNWNDHRPAVNLLFTVVDNAITHATIDNLRTNICDDGGIINSSYVPTVPIIGNSFEIDVIGSTGSNIWIATINGTFNSDTSVSGTEDFLILGQCGLKSGSATFTAGREPDFVLFMSPSLRTIVAGESTTFSVGVRPLGGFNQSAQIDLLVPTVPGVTMSLSSSTVQQGRTVTLNASASANASDSNIGIIIRSSTGSATHFTLASLRVRVFELTVNPDTQVVARGQPATFTLNSRTQAFTTPVALSASTTNGITVNFNSTTLVPGQSTTFTAASPATAPTGTYSITINAQAGQVKETATANLKVSDPDYEIVIAPPTQLVAPGGSATLNVTVRPLLGFNQPVNLSASVSPNNGNLSAGLTAGAVNPGGSATLNVTASLSAQQNSSYTVSVTGTSGSITHTETATVTVSGPDFSLSFDPATVTAGRGQKVKARLHINRVGGFTGEVVITPPDTGDIKVKPGGERSTTGADLTFKLKVKSGAPLGSNDLIFLGRDGTGKQRSAKITLIIQ